MLDIKLIREQPEIVLENLAKRNDHANIHMLHELIEADKEMRDVLQDVEKLRQKRNTITKTISELKSQGKDASISMKEAEDIPKQVKKLEERLEELNTICRGLLLKIPNILHESVPVGKDDMENVEVKKWGKQHFTFTPKNHLELAEKLNLVDTERAAKIAGNGFYYLKKDLVLLDRALQSFVLDFLIKKKFTVIQPPFMMSRKAYEGVTSLADFEDVLYKIEGEDLYPIATSEHPMAAMFMDETLLSDELPIRLAGISPCFRKEVGTHGKYTKGLFRVHHFNKIEQFVFCMPDQSWHIHEELQKISEELYQQLEIPYRVVNVCTGDIGIIAAKKYDTEFLMADGNYREIGSNSNCTDYQARRLNIKYREKEGAPSKGFVHTLNNTAMAGNRPMIAILENHQQEDGTIKIPAPLQQYMNGKKTIEK